MKFRVNFTEYERGWGQRPDGYKDFDSYEKAHEYYVWFNQQNSGGVRVPDIYWRASPPKPM